MKRYVKSSQSNSLYNQLKAVVPNPSEDLDVHESDIYVLKTPETSRIVQQYYDEMGIRNQAEVFTDNISHRKFYDIPFGYMNEYVDSKRVSASTTSRSHRITASSGLSLDQMWDILMDDLGVSEETLQIVTNINGYNEGTMQDILYVVSGYRNFEQLLDE